MKIRKDFIWIIILSIIVLLPNVYLALVGSSLKGEWIKLFVYLFFSVFIFLIPSFILKAKTFFLFEGIFVILAPIEIIHIYLSRMPVSYGFLMAIFETDAKESFELLSSMLPVVFFIISLWIAYFFIAIKKIDNSYLIPSHKIRWTTFGLILFFFLSGFTYTYVTSKSPRYPTTKEQASAACDKYFAKFRKIYPIDLVYKSMVTWYDVKNIEENRDVLKNFSFHACKKKESGEREVYIYIIGETARYHSFSINGYDRKTNPLLEKEDIISLSDFFSEANQTKFSGILNLSRATPQTFNIYKKEKTFVDAYQEAGFKTYWMANQSANTNFFRRIAKDTNGEFFTITDYDAADNLDENLWVFLDEILKKKEEKVFIVMHTLGSHFRYNDRYPEKFNVFHPSFEGAFNTALVNSKNKQTVINTYDNSILYTDYFLAKTIQRLKALNAVNFLAYVSDHGENLYDTKENLTMHAGARPTVYDFHVPCIFWFSDAYKATYPEKVEALKQNKDKKLSSSNIFYSILDAGDITFPEQLLQKSFFSEELKEDSVRYFYSVNEEVERMPED